MGGMADPNIYAPPPYVLRGRSALNGVVIDKGEPLNWGRAGAPPLWDRCVSNAQ